MRITCIRILRARRPKQLRGYAERVVRTELERRGYVVWRAGFAHANRTERYPNIARKYARLERIVTTHYPGTLELLHYLSSTQRGMPDLVSWDGQRLVFTEVKLDYEQLSERQWRCLKRLARAGFAVRIARVVSRATRTRESTINLVTRTEDHHEMQLRLDAFSQKRKARASKKQTNANRNEQPHTEPDERAAHRKRSTPETR